MTTLQIISIAGLLVYFTVLIIAVAKDKKSDSVLEYFFAGRSLPFWALSITFIASWWGAGSAISTADLAYEDGMGAFWYYGVPVLISTLLMIIMSKTIRGVGHLTQGKMMEARYSPLVSKLLSVMIFLFMTITAASQMVGIGDFFGTYLGMDYEIAVLVGTGIVLAYSVLGGFRGVVLTDVIQFCLLLVSAVIVFAIAMTNAGGFAAIAERAAALGKPDYMQFLSGGKKYLAYVITFGCAWMIQANVWQRISATRNNADAKKMTVTSFIAYIPLYLIVVFTGMAGLVLYPTLPKGGVVLAIITDYMTPLVGMIVFVGISAAIMSTMDSLINTGAMTLTVDLYSSGADEKKRLRFSRAATVIVTVLAILISLRVRSILSVSWIASDIITTGVFVPLIAGFIWRRGNSRGAFCSMAVGFAFCLYNLAISLGVPLPAFWEQQSAAQVITGVLVSAAVFVIVSLCTVPEYEKADAFMRKMPDTDGNAAGSAS